MIEFYIEQRDISMYVHTYISERVRATKNIFHFLHLNSLANPSISVRRGSDSLGLNPEQGQLCTTTRVSAKKMLNFCNFKIYYVVYCTLIKCGIFHGLEQNLSSPNKRYSAQCTSFL